MGRPLKFKSVEELQEQVDAYPSVFASPSDLCSDFKNERELQSYIVSNIELFCRDILGDILVSFEEERPARGQEQLTRGPRGKRVDLFILGENSRYVVELKCPTGLSENRSAIGQLLDYGREFLDPEKGLPQLILVTARFDVDTARTIKHYGLPIRYVYLSKKANYEYLGEE